MFFMIGLAGALAAIFVGVAFSKQSERQWVELCRRCVGCDDDYNDLVECNRDADCNVTGCDQPDLTSHCGEDRRCYTGTLTDRCTGMEHGHDLGDGGWCADGRRDVHCNTTALYNVTEYESLVVCNSDADCNIPGCSQPNLTSHCGFDRRCHTGPLTHRPTSTCNAPALHSDRVACNSDADCDVPGCDQPDLTSSCHTGIGMCFTGTFDDRCTGMENGYDLGDGGWC